MDEKQSNTSAKRTSCFEDLPNELIYDIFLHFDYLHIYKSFSNLNHRFSKLITDSNFPITIHLSSISKKVLKHQNENIIEPNKNRIQSFYISNEFMYEIIFPTHEKLLEFNRIEALCLTIETTYLENLLEQLCFLPLLSSLIIVCVNDSSNIFSIYSKIFRLPKLKYCKTSFTEYSLHHREIPFCTNEYSSIERLIITDGIDANIIYNLLSYVPRIRYLSLNILVYSYKKTTSDPISLKNLTHVSLKLDSYNFLFIEKLVINAFSNIQTFHLNSENNVTIQNLNANQWKRLIQSYLLNLRVFNLEYHVNLSNKNERLQFQTELNQFQIELNQFQTSFWIERKWFFSYILHTNDQGAIFYSKQPYRKQCYQLSRLTNEFNLDRIEHIKISDEKSVINCSNFFPNINQLTLTDDYSMNNISICILINRIIPLKQLKKLTLTCKNLSFKKLVELLSYTLNLRELTFQSMLGYKQYQTTINENELFQIVSKTNQIIKLNFQGSGYLEKIHLIVTLCPRIQDLTTHVYRRNCEEITLFLLNRENKNTQYLNHLILNRGDPDPPSTADYLIRKNNLFNDYSWRSTFRREYLWW